MAWEPPTRGLQEYGTVDDAIEILHDFVYPNLHELSGNIVYSGSCSM